MNRDQAAERLAELAARLPEPESDLAVGALDRLAAYRHLCGEIEEALQILPIEGWKVVAAEAFVDGLLRVLELARPPLSSDLEERLRFAVLGGPPFLKKLGVSLAGEVTRAEEPRRRLEKGDRRLVCLELRRSCLESLQAIFAADRAQP